MVPLCGRKLSETCISRCEFLKNNSTNTEGRQRLSTEPSGSNSTPAPKVPPASPLPLGSQSQGSGSADKPAPALLNLHVMGAFRLHSWLNPPNSALLHRWRPKAHRLWGWAWPTPTPSTHTHFLRRIVFAKLFFKYFLYACLSCRVVRSVKARNRFSIWVYLITQTHR